MSRSTVKQATPERQPTCYFDAPSPPPEVLSQMATTEQTLPPPVTEVKQANITEPYPQDSTSREPQTSTNVIVEHPNGSDGWLPTEDPQHMPEPQTAAATGETTSPEQLNGPPPVAATILPVGAGETVRSSRVGSIAPRKTGSIKRGGSAFASGAGTTGPGATADVDEELESRRAEAHRNLTPKQRSKVHQEEAKHSKKLSKIIKEEARTEKKSLALAINDLENLQKHQKAAIKQQSKSEARVQANHQALLNKFKKHEAAYFSAKMEYEHSMARLRTEEETLEALRQNSREATERMQEKAAEVDSLRATLAVDEREREVKLNELKGRVPRDNRHSGFWKNQPST